MAVCMPEDSIFAQNEGKHVSFDASKNEVYTIQSKSHIIFDDIAEDLAYTIGECSEDFEIIVKANELPLPIAEEQSLNNMIEEVDFPSIKNNPFIIKDREKAAK